MSGPRWVVSFPLSALNHRLAEYFDAAAKDWPSVSIGWDPATMDAAPTSETEDCKFVRYYECSARRYGKTLTANGERR